MNFQSIDLVKVALGCVDDISTRAKEQGLTIDFVASNPTVQAEADEGEMRFLMEKLLENALKHTPKGGYITFSLIVSGEQTAFEVANSGSYIDEAAQEKIFSGSAGSPGRGSVASVQYSLEACRLIVKQHDGELFCLSDPNEGTSFCVTIPAKRWFE
ncbi:unnamed protein product [Sphagnum jensenii]